MKNNKKGKTSSTGNQNDDEDEHGDISGLASIIAKRQQSRENQFDALLKKYGGAEKSKGKGKGKGRGPKGKVEADEGEEGDVEMDDQEVKKMHASMPVSGSFLPRSQRIHSLSPPPCLRTMPNSRPSKPSSLLTKTSENRPLLLNQKDPRRSERRQVSLFVAVMTFFQRCSIHMRYEAIQR